MAGRIEDYAMIGNCETVALVCRDGSIDWLGLPRFDSPACFAAILGEPKHGRWKIGPKDEPISITRRYRDETLILETTFETKDGAFLLVDFMSRRDGVSDITRRVKGLRGSVPVSMEMVVRFDYGSDVPWVSRLDDGRIQYVAGPDRLLLSSSAEIVNEDMRTAAEFVIGEGETIDFQMSWTLSYRALPQPLSADQALDTVEKFWIDWSSDFEYEGPRRDIVLRSLITLKALSHWETGGIVAAGTTSLPEKIGGPRNWDYRFCWLRDATLTLYALMESGFVGEAAAWREWLIRAVAGDPDQLQIMYGVAGERRLEESEIDWLPGYKDSKPVRIGNAASGQVQLDVYGEVMNALHLAREVGLPPNEAAWHLECALIGHLESIWADPDDGIWEVRGGRRHFTHSKVMAWVAVDRAIRSAEQFGLPAPLDHWRQLRETIHAEVCAKGFDAEMNSFTQSFGSKHLDASLLMIPLLGFLPQDDPRVRGTVSAIEKDLLRDGFVLRYDTEHGADGLPPGEGAFIACSFWLADTYVLMGRREEAEAMFDRLVGLCNDVGLLAEEYDAATQCQLGNFPQAFSHIALVITALNLAQSKGPVHHRSERQAETVR